MRLAIGEVDTQGRSYALPMSVDCPFPLCPLFCPFSST